MGTKLYVGNLNYRTTDDSLRAAFEEMGFAGVMAKVIIDRESGQSRGFAFVEMASDEDAHKALAAMQGRAVEGRALNVTEARERAPGPARVGPPRIGPPVNRSGPGPAPGPRPNFNAEANFRGPRPSGDFGRPSFGGPAPQVMPHPDLVDPNAAKDGRNRDSRRERREYRGSKHRDDDDDFEEF